MQRTIKRCMNHPDRPVYARDICNGCYQAEARILKKYNLTVKQYQQYLAVPCGICGAPSDVLDHDHTTNEIRGGLCTRCNVNLGVVETWIKPHYKQIQAWMDAALPLSE
jgi:uncharacterized ferredoxin-like protein